MSDLSFELGLKFAVVVADRFGCSVSPSSPLSRSNFHLVASFGQSSVRLNEDSVALMLQACLGGLARDYNVFFLSGWMFIFSVSCKNVGFMVYKLKSFSWKSFVVFFHLWGDGRPNWRQEYALWQAEQKAEWTLVGPKGKPSYADAVRSNPVPKKKVFLCLHYPDNHVANFFNPSCLSASSEKILSPRGP